MNARPDNPSAVQIRPPQLFQSLTTGFNLVANNIYLILLPVVLDSLLWLGPHLRMKALVGPLIADVFSIARGNYSMEMRPFLDSMEKFFNLFLDQYNLFRSLSTFPIGIPSMMAVESPIQTPFGGAPFIEVNSAFGIWMLWLALSLVGLGLGTCYFAWVAQGCSRILAQGDCGDSLAHSAHGKIPPFRPAVLVWQGIQVLAIVILLSVMGMVVLIPSVYMGLLLAKVSQFLAQAALIFILFSVVWFLVPLVFTIHGIFLCGQSLINSMLTSTRIVQLSLPGTGMFLLVTIILYQGLGVLWHVPPENSWLAMVGIFGNAFIATGLLAASFIYYRGGLAYVQSLRNISLNRRGRS
jgi:hypothetical protein